MKTGFFGCLVGVELKPVQRTLRLKAGVDIDWGLNEAEFDLERNVQIERLSALVEHYKSRIEKFEQERYVFRQRLFQQKFTDFRLELLDELRQRAIQNGESGVVYFGLNAEKMLLVEKVRKPGGFHLGFLIYHRVVY
jgi:hypothetical protein